MNWTAVVAACLHSITSILLSVTGKQNWDRETGWLTFLVSNSLGILQASHLATSEPLKSPFLRVAAGGGISPSASSCWSMATPCKHTATSDRTAQSDSFCHLTAAGVAAAWCYKNTCDLHSLSRPNWWLEKIEKQKTNKKKHLTDESPRYRWTRWSYF